MSSSTITLREALDSYGHTAQLSTLALLLLAAAYRHLSPSPPPPGNGNKHKPFLILGEPLPSILLTLSPLLLLLTLGISTLPTNLKADSTSLYIYSTRLPTHLLSTLLPLQILLSHSSPLSPLPWLLRTSRAKLVAYHRILGWSFAALVAAHASLYLNFYVQKGILGKRVRDADVQLGIALVVGFAVLMVGARKRVRVSAGAGSWVWWHVAAVAAIGGLLALHAAQVRAYLLQGLVVGGVGVAWRVRRMVRREMGNG